MVRCRTWASVYFFGPDGELLEITAQARDYPTPGEIEHPPHRALHLAPIRDADE